MIINDEQMAKKVAKSLGLVAIESIYGGWILE